MSTAGFTGCCLASNDPLAHLTLRKLLGSVPKLPLRSCLLQDSVRMVRDLFRDKEATEFIIATIPTVLGVAESGRLLQSLRKEDIPCKRIIVNQVGPHVLC